MEKLNKKQVPKRFLGAFKMGHRPSVKEFVDEEQSWTLLERIYQSDWKDEEAIKALDYLAKFYNEYYRNAVKKGRDSDLHSSDSLRKDCYSRTNARNRDIMSKPWNRIQEENKSVDTIEDHINNLDSEDSDSGS